MQYVGMYTQVRRNNIKSMLLLLAFPLIMLGMLWVFCAIIFGTENGGYDAYGEVITVFNADETNMHFVQVAPFVAGGVAIWFFIAYFFNAEMVRNATGARSLERRENKRIYNMVENLCMTCGMETPKIFVVDDPQLNAYASGIDQKSYAVTLTTGIIDCLNDEELEGVIAHELTHIRNRDTRLLITSIVFVGIVSTLLSLLVRILFNTFVYGGNSRSSNNSKDNKLGVIVVLLVAVVCMAIAYVFILLTRFAISRKREYMADAGGAELCGNPLALASALRKISGNPGLGDCKRDDIAQLFIAHPQGLTGSGFLSNLFSTHPDINDRIRILEQF
ncbi:MAG: M48 family metallopeptidase [Bacteroidaceae bacterium]|nr:M48 family metallopeptidase [Bacteroidaceae bacterium]